MALSKIRNAWHRMYKPMQRWVTPGLRHSQYEYKDKLKLYAPACDGLWLDAGCGRGIFPEWMRPHDIDVLKPGQRIIGLDVDLSSLRDNSSVKHRVAGTLASAPFPPASFDFITANMVVEHIDDPFAAIREVATLLKPGGLLIFHTPNYWNYQTVAVSLMPQKLKAWLADALEGRREKDVFPTFYRLNTSAQIKRVAQACDLRVLDLEIVNSIPETINLGPLVIFELITIRISNSGPLRKFASNIVAVLQKPSLATPIASRPREFVDVKELQR